MTNRQTFLQIGALTAATAAVAWMLHSVPSWADVNAAPSLLAALAAAGTVIFLWVSLWGRGRVSFWWGSRAIGTQPERFVLAVFLAAMPVVYFLQYLAVA